MEILEQWLESVQIQQQLHQNDFVNFEEKSYIVLLFSLLIYKVWLTIKRKEQAYLIVLFSIHVSVHP